MFKKLLIVFALICELFCLGCAGNSVQDMKNNPRHQKTVIIKKPYQEALLSIKTQIDSSLKKVEISTTVYNELKIAEISVQAAFGNHILYIKLTQKNSTETVVEAYLKGVDPLAKKFFDQLGT